MTRVAPRKNLTATRPGFSSLLNYLVLEGSGIVMLKDGSMLAGFWYQGCDLISARPEELYGLRAVICDAFKRLDSRWMLHCDEFRVRERKYICGSFSNPTDRLIDEEAAASAEYLQKYTALYVTWKPSLLETTAWGRSLSQLLSTTNEVQKEFDSRLVLRRKFEEELAYIEDSLARAFGSSGITRMRSRAENCELLQALNFSINGEWKPCRPPARGLYVDCYLANRLFNEASGKLELGDEHVRVITIRGYPAHGTEIGDFDVLENLPIEYRYSNRFIVLGYDKSRSYFEQAMKSWKRVRTNLLSQLNNDPTAHVNQHAEGNIAEIEGALDDVEAGRMYGHHTACVVLRGECPEELAERAKLVVTAIKRAGYQAEIERLDALGALLGSFPGHGCENLRKGAFTVENFADVMPLNLEWSGSPKAPCPLYPPESPPLMRVRTGTGSYHDFNLHVGDLGNTLFVGPPGTGKSTLLALIASQADRYPSQVIVFDKGFSMLPLALARHDGAHYTLGGEVTPELAPLADIDAPAERAWATEWIEGLFELLNVALTGKQRGMIAEAVEHLAQSTTREERSLTDFLSFLQDDQLREAFRYYTAGPGAPILNGCRNDVASARFVVFEIGPLMSMGPRVATPAINYLIRQINKRSNGELITFQLIDEAWETIQDSRGIKHINSVLRTGRKLNIAMVLATQSLTELKDSPLRQVILECCKTRILLPNPDALTEHGANQYRELMGLNDEQIAAIGYGVFKRDYFVSATIRGQHRFGKIDLGLHLRPAAKSFVGASGPDDLDRVRALYEQHGPDYARMWLEERGLPEAAERWQELASEYLIEHSSRRSV